MTSVVDAPPDLVTLADLLSQLGDIAPARVRLHPSPGTATEEDVVRLEASENRLFELVDGALVEKAMGFRESMLAVAIATALREFVMPRNLGVVVGADGMVGLAAGLVRIPDVAFVSNERLPGGRVPTQPIPRLAPDLAVEVLSKSNTPAEMRRKLRDYFTASVRLVWLFDPDARSASIYTAPEQFITLRNDAIIDGGEVLPGFSLSLATLFAELDRKPA